GLRRGPGLGGPPDVGTSGCRRRRTIALLCEYFGGERRTSRRRGWAYVRRRWPGSCTGSWPAVSVHEQRAVGAQRLVGQDRGGHHVVAGAEGRVQLLGLAGRDRRGR